MGSAHYSALMKKNQKKKTITLLMPKKKYEAAKKWASDQGVILGTAVEALIVDYIVKVGVLDQKEVDRRRNMYAGER